MKIWCLFSIENNYDQPMNNLEAFWSHKPTFGDVKKLLDPELKYYVSADSIYDKLSRGEEVRFGGADYRIEEIQEATKL